jgi:DNA polymerase III subunit beta
MESSRRGRAARGAGEFGIGRMSRKSGLTVSALRFYDGAGVLTPAGVDPGTGYRYYAPDQLVVARLVASLRRVGMPLAGIREVLSVRHDRGAVEALLAAHLRRLEQGLADARRELSCVRSLIEQEDPVPPTTVTVRGADLASARRAVRFAVGSDPELPVLGGVLLEVAADAVTLAATDRYRLATATLPVLSLDGPAVDTVLPAAVVDRIPPADLVTITITGVTVRVRAGDEVLDGEPIPDRFPDYRRPLPTDDRAVPVDGAALRAAVIAAPARTVCRDGVEQAVTVLAAGPGGVHVVCSLREAPLGVTDGPGVAVNREFLLEALDAGEDGQLRLSLDGPITPLVARSARSISLLMPVRL